MDEAVGRVERDAAARFLAGRYGPEARDVTELGGGDWSRAFSFRLGERELVARFGRHVEDFEKDQKAQSFRRPELPVPEVLEIGEAPDGFYAISARHHGRFLEELDEPGWRRVLPALLRALDALREIEPPGSGVDWAGGDDPPMSWREWLVASLEDHPGRRTAGWRARLSETSEVEAVFVRGERALRSRLDACPEARHLVHRDLLNRNVLVAEDASRLEALFDWGCSLAGDSVYEVAWFTFWAPWYPALEAIDFRRRVQEHHAATGSAPEAFEERLALYELHVGLEHIAYAAYTGRHEHQDAIVRGTLGVLDRQEW